MCVRPKCGKCLRVEGRKGGKCLNWARGLGLDWVIDRTGQGCIGLHWIRVLLIC